MLTTEEFVIELEKLDDPVARQQFIADTAAGLTDEHIQHLKTKANDWLNKDAAQGLALADNIIYASQVTGRPIHRALGLIVQGNALMRRGDMHGSIQIYDEAYQIAIEVDNPVEAARSQIGKIYSLMRLGEHLQAIEIALRTGETLETWGEYVSAAGAYSNCGTCYAQLEMQAESLVILEKAEALLLKAGTVQAQKALASILNNKSMTLRDMGKYRESLTEASRAAEIAEQHGVIVDRATFLLTMAAAYYLMGHYNRALRLLYESRAICEKHQFLHTLENCDYYICNCYLELGRYEEAVEQARLSLKTLQERGIAGTRPHMVTQHVLGRALMALDRMDEAAETLAAAQVSAETLGANGFKQRTDLRLAEIYLTRPDLEAAETLLKAILERPNTAQLVPLVQLLMAKIELGRQNFGLAQDYIEQALVSFEAQGIQNGLYQGYYLLAEVSEQQNQPENALAWLHQSIEQLERLRGSIASETRSTFLRSKETVYENAVALSLATGQTEQAFQLAERVKSRVLVELVGNQLDVRVRLRSADDQPFVEEIEQLREQHNELTRRLAQAQSSFSTAGQERNLSAEERQKLINQMLGCEKRLAEVTELLQVRNAAYAEDISLAPVYRPFDPTLLHPDEVVVQYFVARGEVLAFVVGRDKPPVVQKLSGVVQLNRLLNFFRLNLATTVKGLADTAQLSAETFAIRIKNLSEQSRALLQKLYTTLFAPLQTLVAGYKHLRIVPHGPLHYLPFHALHNPATDQYLLEAFEEISYLPAANLLRFCRERAGQASGHGALVMGFSNQGALPCTIEEAHQVAATLGCEAYVEDSASLDIFRANSSGQQIVHLAAHGRYRDDAPLFSSLLLAGGELTGYELFNMELKASLLTLSACDSGLGTIAGGDEVLGLSRACLYAGASSLALSLWRVEDRAGSLVMQAFYRYLLQGQGKAAALRQAQLDLLTDPKYRHPFYWAAFILIGDNGPL